MNEKQKQALADAEARAKAIEAEGEVLMGEAGSWIGQHPRAALIGFAVLLAVVLTLIFW